ncbi:MAG: DUF418 domain-containing protein [Verrucomicrobiaceae bacterium]|nr:MAG: DUF418 domain-containing protein [Verrucomicrobiaceae bacterium]
MHRVRGWSLCRVLELRHRRALMKDPGPSPLPREQPSIPAGISTPVSLTDRVPLLDSLRGFALFGILVVNMWGFKVPLAAGDPTGLYIPGGLNEAAHLLINVFANAKFLPIFSFLFGLGLVLQNNRSGSCSQGPRKLLVRRMTVFLGLGFIHGIVLWPGDILMIYSLFGFGALWFQQLGPRTLCNAAVLLMVSIFACTYFLMGFAPEEIPKEEWRSAADQWVSAYRLASPIGVIPLRIQEWFQWWIMGLFYHIPYALSFFLLGIAAGKSNILFRLDTFLPHAMGHLKWSLPLGVVLSLLGPAYHRGFLPPFPDDARLITAAFLICPTLLALSYLTGAAYIFHRGHLSSLASVLADAGRMSLTNYLLQSVIANVIFMGFGFYGRTSVSQGLVFSILIFTLQLFFSRWWMRHHKTGPVEAVVRKIIYPST